MKTQINRSLRKRGYVWILATLFVVIIGTGGIVIMSYLTKLVNQPESPPPDGTPDNVLRIRCNDPTYDTNYWIYDSLALAIITEPRPAPAQSASMMAGSHTIYYGLDDLPWVKIDADPNTLNLGPITYTPTNYSFTYKAIGKFLKFTFSGPSYNPTNTYAYSELPEDNSLHTIIITRSTNMIDWVPVCTNLTALRYDVNAWTDPDPPQDMAFYRAFIPGQPQPAPLCINLVCTNGGLVAVLTGGSLQCDYAIEQSTDLNSWSDLTGKFETDTNGSASMPIAYTGDMERFFRVRDATLIQYGSAVWYPDTMDCGSLNGYVNYDGQFGYYPDWNMTRHSAYDGLGCSTNIVTCLGDSGDHGCGLGTVDPLLASSSYRFSILFPNDLPQGLYPIRLKGFNE